jgi:hypothetical protein
MRVTNNPETRLARFREVSMAVQIRLQQAIDMTQKLSSKEIPHNSECKSMKVMNTKKRPLVQFEKVSLVC